MEITSRHIHWNFLLIENIPSFFKLPYFLSGRPLAVSNIQLNAALKNNIVQIDSTVTAQDDIVKYKVERSNNGTDFTTVSTVSASSSNKYSITDASGNVFYRVSAIDINGQFMSSIVVVKAGSYKVQSELLVQLIDLQGRIAITRMLLQVKRSPKRS